MSTLGYCSIKSNPVSRRVLEDWTSNTCKGADSTSRQIVQTFANFLSDPETRLAPPLIWDGWEAYYHIMHYEGDRSADVN